MKLRILSYAFALLTIAFLGSCGGDGQPEESGAGTENAPARKKSPDQGSMLKVGDKLFNIPSPIETAFLIEEVGGNFKQELLNADGDVNQYSTTQKRAMNLGVYGADLGYALIYGQSQLAFKFLAKCKKLGTELGISSALYADLMKRFEGNMENKDSLLIFVTELNRLSDEYLKENESEDVSAMILTGGWVESLHFTTQLAQSLENEKLRKRIGEQKNSLRNLIGLLQQQNADGGMDDLLAKLTALQNTFDSVEFVYEYVPPTTDANEKLTVINSKSSVNMTDEVLKEISRQVTEIRQSITGIQSA